jgi:serine/threonine protein kinase
MSHSGFSEYKDNYQANIKAAVGSNSIDNYRILSKIRYAVFGYIYLAVDKATEEQVAIKMLNLDNVRRRVSAITGDPVVEDAFNEVQIMQYLSQQHTQHPNILKLLKSFVDRNCFVLVLEYCSQGELFGLIENETFCKSLTSSYFYQLMKGLQFMHMCGVVHRDISLENMLLHADGTLKISDFGLASRVGIHSLSGKLGKDIYIAPEVYSGGVEYDGVKADIWSAGVVLFIMLTGMTIVEYPASFDARFALLENGRLSDLVEAWGLEEVISPSVCYLLQGMLTVDPVHRWTVDMILDHEFVQAGADVTPIESLNNIANDAIDECQDAVQGQENSTHGDQPLFGNDNDVELESFFLHGNNNIIPIQSADVYDMISKSGSPSLYFSPPTLLPLAVSRDTSPTKKLMTSKLTISRDGSPFASPMRGRSRDTSPSFNVPKFTLSISRDVSRDVSPVRLTPSSPQAPSAPRKNKNKVSNCKMM